MIILRNFSKYVVFSEDTLQTALIKINENKSRTVCAVAESGYLEGILTDGDIRRWLYNSKTIDLDQPVNLIMNRKYHAEHINTENSKIAKQFNQKISVIPLIDASGRLVAIALPDQHYYSINGKIISDTDPAFIVAEIGNNHNGNFDLAKKLVDEAIKAGADCVKFQMRDLQKLYKDARADEPSSDLGTQYTLDLLNRFQLNDTELFKIFDYCITKHIIPLCTPWDISSLEKLEKYGGLGAYKVASADFTNYELIDAIVATNKPMICSTGMSNELEIISGIKKLQNSAASFILLHCNSTYPAPFKDVNLKYMLHLKELSGGIVGYSGHERDINVAMAAVTLGAKLIEKHFTLDKTMEGNDHKISLMPDEFSKMVRGIHQIEEALGTMNERVISQGELLNRETLAKSLFAAVDIPKGTIITEKMIFVQSPGQGLQPNRKKDLIGRALSIDKKLGDCFFANDIEEHRVTPRSYNFKRQWGIPVRYHDLHQFRNMSNMNLVEIHLSYKDLEIDFKKYITEPLSLELVIHAPELFKGDHTLNLCSSDYDYRQRSITEMQRVIDLTREIKKYFKTERPCIVTNVGGYSRNAHVSAEERQELYYILEQSLNHLDKDGIEIIPQTMPPFPWHFGGQQYHNLFVSIKDIVTFCQKNKMRVCLDVSHSKLACNYFKIEFSEFLKQIAPFIAHMHLADASGVDGEGIQINEGEIDWALFWNLINSLNSNATFIPEIWQSHKNGGEGIWLALERLEKVANKSIKIEEMECLKL